MKLDSGKLHSLLESLRGGFDGELHVDSLTRAIYSTDASVYQERPAAVAFPRSEADIQRLIEVARAAGVGLIPRTAGTSLAGQVVGSGIVVDVSRHFTRILEISPAEGWVRAEPGVIRNELNRELTRHGLFFGPETSTQNRAMIGGMLGNNSCGSNSIVYRTTRDQTLEVEGFLSDGSRAVLGAVDEDRLQALLQGAAGGRLEQQIYRGLWEILFDGENQREIRRQFPDPAVHRRNTGYALDAVLDQAPFSPGGPPLNLAALIAGSEGTLFLATAIRLRCHPLPPPHRGLVCAHFSSLRDSLLATPVAMQFPLHACELIDHHVLEGAARNLEQQKNMQFVHGTPATVLLLEVRGDTPEEVTGLAEKVIASLQQAGLGYAWPLYRDAEADPVWELRKAGQGIVSGMVGDTKPVTVIEDTAVGLGDFAEYTLAVERLLREKYGRSCVFYGHAGAGELHLRPLLNLKTAGGRRDFRGIATDVAALVRKYRGSLSGEHGDGRLRGEFLESMVGPKNYALLRRVKELWDPDSLFNPGKIIDTPPMDASLRDPLQQAGAPPQQIPTVLDFSAQGGLLGAAEMCNGSGDCRKTHPGGGTMCPSYMATRDEKDTTRARANLMRQLLTGADSPAALVNRDLKEVMDLCLSCKGCRAECPSNVDLARLKAEFQQAWHDRHGIPLRTRLVAGVSRIHRIGAVFPRLHNFLVSGRWTAPLLKRLAGFTPHRSLPRLQNTTLRQWYRRRKKPEAGAGRPQVILFCDEFTNHLDTEAGIAAVELLEALGSGVQMVPHAESGRAAISKGMLRQARAAAERNVALLEPLVSEEIPLVGIEPSALLSVVDEYPDLVGPGLRGQARRLASHTMLVDEYLSRAILAGRIRGEAFVETRQVVRLHGHCHQKALTSLAHTVRMLQAPAHYEVRLIPSGCCGMAGSFGYEREHYRLSQQIGELVLFPVVRSEPASSLIAAPGTSCRQQILDGTGRRAFHPVEILHAALRRREGKRER